MRKTNTQENSLRGFMSNVNKLTPGRSCSDKFYGRVTCIHAADYSKGKNSFLGRSGYGTRKFSVRNSAFVKSGSYTLGGLRAKLQAAIR